MYRVVMDGCQSFEINNVTVALDRVRKEI